jgi:subtilisin-like proprotein convertase family protein
MEWGMGRMLAACGLAVAFFATSVSPAIAETPGDAGFVIAGTKTSSTGIGVVRVYADNEGNSTYETLADEFVPFSSSTSTPDGVRVAAGDFNDDGQPELVAAAGEGNGIRIYELTTSGEVGALVQKVNGFTSGSYVAAGDINNDGRDELAVGTDATNTAVRIYTDSNDDGLLDTIPTETFNAYTGETTGARVALGDLNGGGAELIVGPGPSAGLPVKIYQDTDADVKVSDNPVLDSFVPYGASYAGGTYVASGPIQSAGTGSSEVTVSAATGQGKKVIVRTDSDGDGLVSDDPVFDELAPPYGTSTKGVRVASGDTDHSGAFHELITASGGATQPIKIFDDNGDVGPLLSDNPISDSFGSTTANTGSFVAFAHTTAPVKYAATDVPLTLTDNATTVSRLVVPASAGIINDLDVDLGIFHTFDGDLDVSLQHITPSGSTTLALFHDVGGTCEGFLVTLSDEFGVDMGSASCGTKLDNPISGIFNPEDIALLSVFDGVDASGSWSLIVKDDSVNDSGTLNYWDLSITY